MAAALLVGLAAHACSGSPGTPSPGALVGRWGGEHAIMIVGPSATGIEFDCAHGEIPAALAADASGAFSVAGVFVREHGGPTREDEPADTHPAEYSGTAARGVIRLTYRLTDTGETGGTYTLVRDAPGRLLKCL